MGIGSVSINSSLVRTQRALARSIERLSTGRRISSARDDVGQFAQGIRLESSRAAAQAGIRNVTDGLSALAVADTAANELVSVLQSIRELAVQASNSTLSTPDRESLQGELNQLLTTYTHIVNGATFSGIDLLNGQNSGLTLSFGDDQDEIELADLKASTVFTKSVATGTFDGPMTTPLVPSALHTAMESVDFNGDGKVDLAIVDSSNGLLRISLGNGDGTFKSALTTTITGSSTQLAVGDFNGDSIPDIVTGASTQIRVALGNGDGTFSSGTVYSTDGGTPSVVLLGDLNNDGALDIVTSDNGNDTGTIFLGNGNGTFAARTSVDITAPGRGRLADMNGDGDLDLVVDAGGNVEIQLGNGDGTFAPGVAYTGFTSITDLQIADINRDGTNDVIFAHGSGLGIYFGNSNGSLQAVVSSNNGVFSRIAVHDVNGDGLLDVIGTDFPNSRLVTRLGNGNGTFAANTSVSVGNNPLSIVLSDVNNDGVKDLAIGFTGGMSSRLARTREATAVGDLSVETMSEAERAIELVDSALQKLTKSRAGFGASQSGLELTLDSLYTKEANLSDAVSRIMDTDTALEVAELVRLQILQEAQMAVEVQANVIRARVLELLDTR